jgi:aspartate carbamoyltransferase catalytic subunit
MTDSRCEHQPHSATLRSIACSLKPSLAAGAASLTHPAQSWLDLLGVDNAHLRLRAQPL